MIYAFHFFTWGHEHVIQIMNPPWKQHPGPRTCLQAELSIFSSAPVTHCPTDLLSTTPPPVVSDKASPRPLFHASVTLLINIPELHQAGRISQESLKLNRHIDSAQLSRKLGKSSDITGSRSTSSSHALQMQIHWGLIISKGHLHLADGGKEGGLKYIIHF